MDNYIKSATDYVINSKTRDLKDFDNYMGEDVDIFKYCPYCGGEIEFSEVEL